MPQLLFALPILLGAFLLFLVQPMAAKWALPTLGGAPFVWNGCMVFFQAVLLAGYLYAHASNRLLPLRAQLGVHFALLILAALFAFPLSFVGVSGIDPAHAPLTWLLAMLLAAVGLPFFAMSATSPLVQAWYSAATRGSGRNPYALYAASNIGSFGALLAYPALVEPFFPLKEQAVLLQYGYLALALLFAVLIAKMWHVEARVHAAAPSAYALPDPKPDAGRVLHWLALAFVPSSLLYGVTSYITTDIASAPLFWVVPLALYLLTFVFAFATRPRGVSSARSLHLPGAALMAAMSVMGQDLGMLLLAVHLLVFFAVALSCHGRLAELKPAPSHLTGFYLWVSLGGVLGGAFNTFAAPALFKGVYEYPLVLLASIALIGGARHAAAPRVKLLAWLLLLIATLGLTWLAGSPQAQAYLAGIDLNTMKLGKLILLAILVLVVLAYLFFHPRPLWYAGTVALMLVVMLPAFRHAVAQQVTFSDRNIFGVSRVLYSKEWDSWEFRHGTTNHGMQSAREDDRLNPTTYYTPLKQLFAVLPKELRAAPVAVLGMGVGTVACYGREKQAFDFYEIDPIVEEIAMDERYFTYLRDCPPEKNIVLGDGRIGIGNAPDAQYGLVIADAFSSDSIPTHLVTREAVALYREKLKPEGAMAFNISNRHIKLLPVLSAIADSLNLHGATLLDQPPEDTRLIMASQWVVLTPDTKLLEKLKKQNPAWQDLPTPDPRFLWRDDYSNLLRSMAW